MEQYLKSEKKEAAKDLVKKARPERRKSGEGHVLGARAEIFKKVGLVSQSQTHFYCQVSEALECSMDFTMRRSVSTWRRQCQGHGHTGSQPAEDLVGGACQWQRCILNPSLLVKYRVC